MRLEVTFLWASIIDTVYAPPPPISLIWATGKAYVVFCRRRGIDYMCGVYPVENSSSFFFSNVLPLVLLLFQSFSFGPAPGCSRVPTHHAGVRRGERLSAPGL